MIAEIKEINELTLKEIRICNTGNGKYITVITADNKEIILYLPKNCPYLETTFSE